MLYAHGLAEFVLLLATTFSWTNTKFIARG